MKEVVDFLTSLSKAVSTMGLYEEGHPARERVVDDVHEAVQRLQEVTPRPEFTFLGEEIILDRRPIRSLKNWDWSGRLAGMGIQRLGVHRTRPPGTIWMSFWKRCTDASQAARSTLLRCARVDQPISALAW